MTSNNVVDLFPDRSTNKKPLQPEELKKIVSKKNEDFLTAVSVEMAEMVNMHLAACGFNDLLDEHPEQFCFIIESIKSLLFKQYGLEHTLQDLSEMTIKMDEGGDSYVFVPPRLIEGPNS
jgi:hypothetical protein